MMYPLLINAVTITMAKQKNAHKYEVNAIFSKEVSHAFNTSSMNQRKSLLESAIIPIVENSAASSRKTMAVLPVILFPLV